METASDNESEWADSYHSSDEESNSSCEYGYSFIGSDDDLYSDSNYKFDNYKNDRFKESLEDAFKNISEEEDESNHELCLLIDGFNYMADDFISIMRCSYDINIWPDFTFDRLNDASYMKVMKLYIEQYKKLIRSKLECSQVIVVLVTNSFCESGECMELLKYSKTLKKTIIGLVVEEMKSFDHETQLKGLDFSFEFYKERLSDTGYDQYLWISSKFIQLIEKLRETLKKDLPEFNDNEDEDYGIHLFHTIHNADSVDSASKFYEKFKKLILGNQSIHIDSYEYSAYADLTRYFKTSKEINKNYTPDKLYHHLDMKLESLHLVNKNDYLSIIQHFDQLIDMKLDELELDNNQEFKKKPKKLLFDALVDRIILKLKLKWDFRNHELGVEQGNKDFYIVCRILKLLKGHYMSMGLDLSYLNEIIEFLECKNHSRDGNFHYGVMNANAIIMVVFKEFYKSGKFEKILKNFISFKKPLFFVKFQNFKIDPKIYEEAKKEGLIKGVYDLWKHEKFDYDGYELRRLFNDLSELNCPIDFHNHLFQQKYDVFICEHVKGFKNVRIKELEKILKKKNIRTVDKSQIKKIENEKYEIFDLIERSKIVIFVLTKEYFISDRFKEEYEYSCEYKKAIIYILLEEITRNGQNGVEFKHFNTVLMYNSEKPIWNDWYLFYHTSFLICSALDQEQLVSLSYSEVIWPTKTYNANKKSQNANFILHSLMHKKSIYPFMSVTSVLFDFTKNGHLLALGSNNIHIFDRLQLKFIKTISITNLPDHEYLTGVCHMKHLNLLCLITNSIAIIMDHEYNIISKNKNLCYDMSHIEYSESRKANYIYGQSIKSIIINDFSGENKFKEIKMTQEYIVVKSMKILNDKIYLLTNDSIFVYDLDVNPISIFGKLHYHNADSIISTNNKKLDGFLFISSYKYISVYCLNTYKLYDEVEIPESVYLGKYNGYHTVMPPYMMNPMPPQMMNQIPQLMTQLTFRNGVIINDTMIGNSHDCLNKFEIFYKNSRNSATKEINDEYICKLDPYNHHLLHKPFQLPCENIACLECIYKNYNLCKNIFTCKFVSCKIEHNFTNELVKSNVIEVNLKPICEYFIQYVQKLPKLRSYYDEKVDTMNSYFDMIENNIDIRYESLQNDFDKLQAKLLNGIDKFQERILLNNAAIRPIKLKNQNSNKLIIDESKFGSLKALITIIDATNVKYIERNLID